MDDAQYYLIGTDGRQYGPISPDEVRTLLTDGRASRYSRARRTTESQWTALRELAEFEEATRPPFIVAFDPDSAAHTEEAQPHVPASTGQGASSGLDPVACFRRAWQLVSHDFPVLAGWTLLAASIIILISAIPYAGLFIGLLLNNLLMSGVYVLYLARMRGFRPSFGDVATVVRTSAIAIVLAGLAQLAMTAAGLLLLILPGIYLAVGYAFVIPLIIDRGMPVWTAMELSRTTVHKQWFQTFGLLVAAGMLLFISAQLYGFLLVVTLPLCTAALMYAYAELFG
jgi:hypothetical protein